MGGSSEPMFLWAQKWPDYRGVHCGVLLSRHGEGGELDPNQLYTNAGCKGHPTDIGQDSRLGFTPPGLVASNVLCSGVHEIHGI